MTNLAYIKTPLTDSYFKKDERDDYAMLLNLVQPVMIDDVKESGISGSAELPFQGDSYTSSGQEPTKPSISINYEQKEFKSEVIHALNEEPIEDGYIHPAENIIEETIKAYQPYAGTWIQSLYIDNLSNPTLAAGILRCIGRLNPRITQPWGSIMATGALLHPDVEVREAAVRAIEMLEDPTIIGFLERREEKVPWLADYIKQVIKDLKR